MPKYDIQTTIYCDHCDANVSRNTYYRHRRNKTSHRYSKNIPKRTRNVQVGIAELSHEDFDSANSQTRNQELLDSSQCQEFTNEIQDLDPGNRQICNQEFELLDSCQKVSIESLHFANAGNEAVEDQTTDNSSNEDISDENGNSEDDDTSSNTVVEDQQPEVWEDVSPEQLISDLNCCDPDSHPCPEPQSKDTHVQKATNLLKWFVYFILLWQSFCKLSDNGLEWFLQFHSQFFKALANICGNSFLQHLATGFPTSIYLLRKLAGLDRDAFKKYAVCTKCSKLYEMDKCTEIDRYGKRVVKFCTNKKFSKSKACGAPLSKRVTLGSTNQEQFYPLKIYCYNSIINKLEEMLCRDGFPEDCEKWRQLTRKEGYLSDVIDGDVWNEFNSEKRGRFLGHPRNFMFMLNFDFFQPMKHRNDYSVGVLYLANLNLPRNIRFKWENIIVAGVIPDLENGKPDLNEFLGPLVSELKALWSGVYLKTSLSNIPLKCRAALACVACDIPAARKLCGFKSHNSNHACSKCLKFFTGNVKDSFDYSGFDRAHWQKRDVDKQRRFAKLMQKAKTKSEYQRMSMKYGIYYSALVELDYFDAVRFTVVDPMHNLFLGTAKTMYKIWVEDGLLSPKDIKVLESRIKQFDVGTGLGRLPHKISSNYGCYTAAQWKNWTLIYSVYALNGLLPELHLQCWQAYVLACKFLTRPVISKLELDKADMMLIQFCKKFERLYGKSRVTPNMHLHGHLKECVMDYGPVYNFWCFSFERYNGIVSSFTTNNRSIEVQLMRKIITDRFLFSISFPSEFEEIFLATVQKQVAVLTDYVELGVQLTHASMTEALCEINWQSFESQIILPKVHKLLILDDDDVRNLASVYNAMYGVDFTNQHLSKSVRIYGNVALGNEKFGSKKESRTNKSSRIVATWSSNSGQINCALNDRPGFIQHFIQHMVQLNGGWVKHVFAVVDWFEESPQKGLYGKPVEVWKSLTIAGGPSRFLPLARIKTKFVMAESPSNQQMVIVPLNRTFSF